MTNKLTLKQSLTAGLLAGLASAIINGILFYIFHAAGIITDDIFVQPEQPLTIIPVVISSIIPSLLGGMIFYFIDKKTSNGYNIFRTVAIILLLLSLGNPFMGIKGVTTGYAVALDLMHVVVAVSLLFFIRKQTLQLATR